MAKRILPIEGAKTIEQSGEQSTQCQASRTRGLSSNIRSWNCSIDVLHTAQRKPEKSSMGRTWTGRTDETGHCLLNKKGLSHETLF